jgi:hypothetical protein
MPELYKLSLRVRNWLFGTSNWVGSSSFVTTGLSKVISMPGVTAADQGFAIPAVTPGAAEFLGVTCATDQITVFRNTGTTSGLAFHYFVIRQF